MAPMLPPTTPSRMQNVDNSTCMELALEGERLCKSGDCRSGVAFLEAALQASTDDLRTLTAIYSQLGNAYFYLGEYKKAVEYHKHDLTLARTMKDKAGEAKASGNLGNTLKVLCRYDEALICCKRHLEISQQLGDQVAIGRALYNLANVYHSKGKHLGGARSHDPGEFPEVVRECLLMAVNYYNDNHQLMVELGDRSAQGRACGNLGNTHYLLGNFVQAINFHQQRLKIAREFGDKSAERRAHSNLGNAHIFLGQFETAAEQYKKTLLLAQELGDKAMEAQACYSLGNTYTLMHDYSSAIDYHIRHMLIAQELNDRVGQGRACWSLGNAHAASGCHDQALFYAEKHLQISEEIGDAVGLETARSNLTEFRRSMGRSDSIDSADRRQTSTTAATRQRRQSMERMDLLKTTNEERGVDGDDFFEVLSQFQSKRMDDQRCSIGKTAKNSAGAEMSSLRCDPLQEDLVELIADMQSYRMDEQRADPQYLPGFSGDVEMVQRLNSTVTNDGLPDDDFMDMLVRFQGSRLNDQRACLPATGLPEKSPTIPDEDFFSLIQRLQSDRLDDQRCSLPPAKHRLCSDD